MTLALSGCNETSVGDLLDPMQWETYDNGQKVDVTAYSVPAEGGTYNFACTNYLSYWIASVQEDDNALLFPDKCFSDEADSCTGLWSNVLVQNNNLIVTIVANDTDQSRTLYVTIEAGDAFSRFVFTQSPKTAEKSDS
jgi:hypothetical protein